MPLRKVPGPQNPSDLCTKNVPAALMEQYLAQLQVYHAEGHAAVAQQLHAIGPRSPVIASLGVGVLLPGVIGGRMISVGGTAASFRGEPSSVKGSGSVTRRSSGGLRREGPDPEDHSSVPGARDKLARKYRSTSPEERCVDSCVSAGAGGVWRRAHRTPRRALFTPFRVAGGPENGAAH